MPVYEYRCTTCGPFDHHREMAQATAPLPCPTCSNAARRAYTVPGVRSRAGLVGTASTSDRARIDRARTGAPAAGPLSGRRLRSAPHPH